MKKQLPAFLTGVIVSALVFTAVPAIAAQIQSIDATLNSVNIEVNGAKVASAGEDYTLENGKQTAGSIVFNETTYVPIRRFGEVMGADIGWNQETGSVTVGGGEKAATPATTPAPDTVLSDDYSTWSAEEEAAYQEFKGMWEVNTAPTMEVGVVKLRCYKSAATGDSISEAVHIGESVVDKFLKSNTVEFIEKCCSRFSWELYKQYGASEIRYGFDLYGIWGWPDRFSADGLKCGYRDYWEQSTLP